MAWFQESQGGQDQDYYQRTQQNAPQYQTQGGFGGSWGDGESVSPFAGGGWYDTPMGGGGQAPAVPQRGAPRAESTPAGGGFMSRNPWPAAGGPTPESTNTVAGLRSGGGGGGGTIWAGPNIQNPMSFKAPAFPTLPTWKAPEYKPPEEDENVYWNQREKEVGSGFRRAQRGLDQAMMSFNSVDNPAQRDALMSATLQGFGRGIEEVAAGAGARARSYADRKRGEQLQIYNTQWGAQTQEASINYQNQIQKMIMDYTNQQSVWSMMQQQNVYDWGRQDIRNRYNNSGFLKPPSSSGGYGSWRL